jgi:hypothetical protein
MRSPRARNASQRMRRTPLSRARWTSTNGMTRHEPEHIFIKSFQVTLSLLARRHPLPCKAITVLISQSLDRKLPLYQRLLLRLHLYGCLACVRFQTQVRLLRALLRLREQQSSAGLTAEQSLSAAARARLHLALQQAADN